MDTQSFRPGHCPLNTRSSSSRSIVTVDEIEKLASPPLSRRILLKIGGASAVLVAALAGIGSVAWIPKRTEARDAPSFPDIQFDIGKFIGPVQTMAGVPVHFGPVFTFLAPAKLTRTPTRHDQKALAHALHTIEEHYPFSPSGIFTFVAYGLPYFNRLPSSLVAAHMPLRNDGSGKPVLEEAVPGPTDVSPLNSGISKQTFNVPVQIETNDVLFTLRSDSLANITEVSAWLNGGGMLHGDQVPSPDFGGLFDFATPRINFVQPGLPRKVAERSRATGLAPFTTIAGEINPASSMWMGFVDQQVAGSAPDGATVTFAGSPHGVFTTAVAGNYFDNGAIQHLSHVIDDLAQFYALNTDDPTIFGQPFHERIQYMFRSKKTDGTPGLPFPEDPHDPLTNGGGLGAPTGNLDEQQQSAFLNNLFFGPNDQTTNFDPTVTDHHKYRVGHLSGLHRSGRAADGTPLHIRNDGPGLSNLDVPDGSNQPTLEFTVFVPTAEFFRVLRVNSASLDYVKVGDQGGTATSVPQPFFPAGPFEPADSDDDGLERFLTATRRQNFLIPPRRYRAFPLLEFT